jgi:uncharacterized protein
MAKLTLQEQLLKSGLVSTGQARAVKSEKHKQTKQQQHNKATIVDDIKVQAQQVRLEQAEHDRELNQRRKQEEDRKHLAAQIKQLIEQNRLPKSKASASQLDDDIAYHFTDGSKVKTLYVSQAVRDQIVQGQLAIVRLGKHYELVGTEVAEKIKLRDESCIIALNTPSASDSHQQDPYADYPVPDDLMW